MSSLLYISISGLAGIWLRYFVTLGFERINSSIWIATLMINVSGSFFAGALFAASIQRQLISEKIATILLIGFCGGFTTFSSYSLQNLQLIHQGHYTQAAFYFLASPLLGLLAAYAGAMLIGMSH